MIAAHCPKQGALAVPVWHCRPDNYWKVAALQVLLEGWSSWGLVVVKNDSPSNTSCIVDRLQQGQKVLEKDHRKGHISEADPLFSPPAPSAFPLNLPPYSLLRE
ncbi:hypothetical protein STEG23_023873, partial [Scotinomys teguina]